MILGLGEFIPEAINGEISVSQENSGAGAVS